MVFSLSVFSCGDCNCHGPWLTSPRSPLSAPPPFPQSIPIPLGGDEKAIEAYATKVEALKKKVGATTIAESLAEREAALSSTDESSDAPFEALLASIENARTGDAEKDAALKQWADDVRASVGAPATAEEAAAQAASLAERLESLTSGLPEKKPTVVDAYAQHVSDIKASVDAELAKVQKDGGLEWVSVDLKNVAPKA